MSTAAGWYDDGSGRQRWWDGTQWTDHYETDQTAPTPPPGYAPPVYAAPVYAAPVGYVLAQPGISPKSYMVAWLLSLFLGVLGIDRFYMGNIGLGVAKLLLCWLTGGIWWLIDFLIIVTKNGHDGQGLRVVQG